jgi:PAS domain S-box-containing protein
LRNIAPAHLMDQFPFSPISSGEKNMRSANDDYRLHELIINRSEFAVISTNLDGIITSFNSAAEKLTGFDASEVIGLKSITEFYPQEELVQRADTISHQQGINCLPGLESITVNVREKEKTERQESNFVSKTGDQFPVVVSMSSLWLEDLHIGYCAIATSVTDQITYRKKIEESEAQLKALISSIDDIVFELDEQGRFRHVWVKSDDFLFLPREKIYGRTLSEMMGPDFSAPFEEGFRNVVVTGEPFNWEYKSPAPGDDRWFVAKTAVIFDRGVKTNRISVCIQNITDRKKMELSIRESEEKFRLLAENIPGVVYLMKNSEPATIMYISSEIENLTGYKAAEFLSGSKDLFKLIHEEDRVYVSNVRKKSVEDKISFQLEYRIQHHSGAWRWISETGTSVNRDENILLEGCLTDITPRKESEEELRRMADENSRIFNNTLTLGALATFDGYFKKLNPAWEKTLGWTRDELMSKPFAAFIHPDDLGKTSEILTVISSGHTVPTFENRYRCKDGSYRWLLWSSSPDIARKLIYASAIDITSRKKSEEELLMSKRNLEVAAFELEEQNRQLDEFAHIISHNLRAPVNNIKALLNFINDSSRIGDYQLIFEKIKNVTFNISETMNELLETIRIKKNNEIERVEIRFKDILDKVIQSLEGELIESGATVTYNFNNAPKVYYSKPYLESILQNLLSNSIKYRSPNRIPEIFVSTDLVKNGIELRVQDNGLGIDMKQFGNKLFGLHKTFHENKEARGVGLFLTKTQIETLGGSITAESEVDKGTTFIIQF